MRTLEYTTPDEIAALNAEPWMVDLVRCNPEYCHWGPYEDYMMRPGRDEPEETNPRKKGHGWESRVLAPDWKSFGPWRLDELNECVHFYFEINRESKKCETCGGSGYHPDAAWVADSFYEHSSPFRDETEQQLAISNYLGGFSESPVRTARRTMRYPSAAVLKKYKPEFRTFCKSMRDGKGYWGDDDHPDDMAALKAEGRDRHGLMGHDCINRHIMIRARLERYGVPLHCPDCEEGMGYQYTEPAAHLSLILWWLHPSKGCSRGIEIKRIQQSDLPAVQEFLRKAAERNAARFEKILAFAVESGS